MVTLQKTKFTTRANTQGSVQRSRHNDALLRQFGFGESAAAWELQYWLGKNLASVTDEEWFHPKHK